MMEVLVVILLFSLMSSGLFAWHTQLLQIAARQWQRQEVWYLASQTLAGNPDEKWPVTKQQWIGPSGCHWQQVSLKAPLSPLIQLRQLICPERYPRS